jgi:hypothetical protein
MPYTKQDLITLYSLDEDAVNQTLTAAELSVDSESYTDEQIQTGFDLIRSYFNNGQVSDYAAAAELFKQHQSQQQVEGKPQAKNKKIALGNKPTGQEESNTQQGDRLNVLELIDLATKNCLVKVELVEAIQIMPLCGLLPNQSEFAPNECERFVLACDLIKKHNKSYEEVAEHFGVGNSSKTRVNSPQQLLELLGDSTIVVDENLMDLVNKITAKQTNGVNLHKLVRQSYFMNLSHQMSENQDDTDTFFADLESRLMDYIEGKSRARSLGTTWEWAPHSLPPSSTKLIGSPEDSNNGTSGE